MNQSKKMDCLPKVVVEIIYDYKYQLEHTEKYIPMIDLHINRYKHLLKWTNDQLQIHGGLIPDFVFQDTYDGLFMLWRWGLIPISRRAPPHFSWK